MNYFTDPILRAPMMGSLFMGLMASLIGVLTFLRKRSLLAESLSHASYPGAVFALMFSAFFFPSAEPSSVVILIGAFLLALLGLFAINKIHKKGKVKNDAALCLILSGFFGVGLTFASLLQWTHPLWYKKIQLYLFGQTATLTDPHIFFYGGLAFLILLFITVFFRPIQAIYLDKKYAETLGLKVSLIEYCTTFFLVFSVVSGIRCVGIVLMSGMLIAPPLAARQWTDRLSTMLILSAFFGMASAFLGNVLSYEWIPHFAGNVSFPTGPSIILFASFFAFFSLFFAPKRGVLFRLGRILKFKLKCQEENLLKWAWKRQGIFSLSDCFQHHSRLAFFLSRCKRNLRKIGPGYLLTTKGRNVATQIVRLHRLWEVYLMEHLGLGADKVHPNAEEMEHILTPEMEEKLTNLLSDPKRDPHNNPIPEKL